MRTRKLINTILIIIFVSLTIYYIFPLTVKIYYESKFLFYGMCACVFFPTLITIIPEFMSGGYDKCFEKYTDPHLKKLCDFLNRRNGGCNE